MEPSPTIPAKGEEPEIEMPEAELPLEPSPTIPAKGEVSEIEMPEAELPLEPSPTIPAEGEEPEIEMPETELPLEPSPTIPAKGEVSEIEMPEAELPSEPSPTKVPEDEVTEKDGKAAPAETVEVDGDQGIEELIDQEMEGEEVPVVKRTDQWKLKPPPKPRGPRSKAAAKSKSKAKAAAKSKSQAKNKNTGKAVVETIDLEADGSDHGGEVPKRRNAASSSRPKRAKRKQEQSMEQGHEVNVDDKESEKIVWGPISKEGAEEFVKNFGNAFPQDGVEIEEAQGAKADEESCMKSFARRVCPKSSPAREKWVAIRDCFNETLKDYIINDLGASAYPVEEWGQNISGVIKGLWLQIYIKKLYIQACKAKCLFFCLLGLSGEKKTLCF